MKELALHMLDIMGNSVRAHADLVELTITESRDQNLYRMEFRDNGKGMDKEMLSQALNPWMTSRTERKVGLGLSLLQQNAELCDGYLNIESKAGPEEKSGTLVEVMFKHNHLDRPVAGDIPGTLVTMASSWPNIDFLYTHATDTGTYTFDTREVKAVLDGVSIGNRAIMEGLKEMIRENLNHINAECH